MAPGGIPAGVHTDRAVRVDWQLVYGLDDLAGQLYLACIFDQPGLTADLVCC
jgi:hypothetical protein